MRATKSEAVVRVKKADERKSSRPASLRLQRTSRLPPRPTPRGIAKAEQWHRSLMMRPTPTEETANGLARGPR